MNYSKQSLIQHRRLKGKLSISLKAKLNYKDSLSLYYTPGVGAVSSFLAKNPSQAKNYTWLNNCVAVISDGSAVLGLGDIGPYGALPVMEGKAMLFKHFANIDAVPIILDVHSPDQIISAVEAIAPSFGGINLEDISAPKCFDIENSLKKKLPIPVFHDDQHGTAIVALAALINACKITQRRLDQTKIVIVGAGSAGVAIAKLLRLYSSANIVALDSKGVLSLERDDLTPEKKFLAGLSSVYYKANCKLEDVITDADIFIGVSKAKILNQKHIHSMAKKPIILAMANPIPEILPLEAYRAGAAVIATGRSDFPNQVNNALAFPGIFRGALDNGVRDITDKHKIAAAETIASLVKRPTFKQIVPSIRNKHLVPAIAKVIK
jgi:malate dehydrogenase (oxaloacetate-decarboxylating)